MPLSLPLDHVAIAVPSIADAARLYGRLAGVTPTPVEDIASQGVRVSFIGNVELLEPLSPDSPVGRFLARRGPGLHHIAYRTSDLPAELERLVALGLEPVHPEPETGRGGHRVSFLHPRSTGGVLIELVERDDGPAGATGAQ